MSSPFVHLELTTSNLDAAKDFYSGLFGWSFSDMPMPEFGIYSTFRPDPGPGGGMFAMPGAPPMWLPYIGIEDIHAATKKATSLGATVIRGPQEVPGMGWFTVLADPTGAMIAIWQGTGQTS